VRRAQVAGPQAGGQAIGRVVGAQHQVIDVGPAHDGEHRAEDLFAGHAGTLGTIEEHARLDEVPAFQVLGAAATANQFGALLLAALQVALDRIQLPRGHQRAHAVGRVQAVAEDMGGSVALQFFEHLIQHAGVYVQARCRRTHLALVVENPIGGALGGAHDVGVGQDDVR